jgi:hypothetical protein
LVYSDEFGRFRDGNNCPSKKIDIEDMFRDFKAGGYSLEGSQLATQYLSKLIIVIAIAYTSATMQGKKIKDMGIQKYVMSQDLKKDIAFLIHKRYIPDPEQLNQQRFKCAAQMREPLYKGQRRHSSFYVGQHLYHWLQLHQIFQKNIE